MAIKEKPAVYRFEVPAFAGTTGFPRIIMRLPCRRPAPTYPFPLVRVYSWIAKTSRKQERNAMTQQPEIRQEHPYFMYDAIIGQPEAMAAMLDRHAAAAREVAAALATRRNIYIVGIGTSWHAVLVAEHWFRRFAGPNIQVQGWHSFEFLRLPAAPGSRGRGNHHQPPGYQDLLLPGFGVGQGKGRIHRRRNLHRPRPAPSGGGRFPPHRIAGTVFGLHHQLHHRPHRAGAVGVGTGRGPGRRRRDGATEGPAAGRAGRGGRHH